jgi:hypothetical protein
VTGPAAPGGPPVPGGGSVPGGAAAPGPRRSRWLRRGPVLAGLLVLALAAGLGVRFLGGGDDRGGPTPDPVAGAGPTRTDPLSLQLPVNPAELPGGQLDEALDQAQQAGVTTISAGVTWWFVTQRGGPFDYDWGQVDRLVAAAGQRGLAVRLQLSGTPDSVHPDLAGTVDDLQQRIWYPPRTGPELDAWSRFVTDTVTRYRGQVTSYEMWNEPNIRDFWKPDPDPAEYATLLERSYRAAKAADPAAQVVFGGISRNDVGYLQAYYRAAGPDAAAHNWWFDLLDVHPYTDGRSPDDTAPDATTSGRYGLVDQSYAGLRLMKAAMDRQEGDSGKEVLVGEFGYSTTGVDFATAVDDRTRAYFLTRAVAIADRLSWVAGLSWYGYLADSSNDPGWAIAAPGAYDTWTFQALRDLGSAPLALPATLAAGTEVRAGAAGVTRVELWVDGRLRASADGPVLTWPDGVTGRVQLAAYTTDRHVLTSAVRMVTAGD